MAQTRRPRPNRPTHLDSSGTRPAIGVLFFLLSLPFGFPAVWCACIDSVIPVLHDWLKRSNVQFASEVIFEVPFFFVGVQLMDPFFGKRFDG